MWYTFTIQGGSFASFSKNWVKHTKDLRGTIRLERNFIKTRKWLTPL